MRKNGISVIVCCYNSADKIEETLHCLFTQDVVSNIDWEIIVVDNNSRDNTSEVAKKYNSNQQNNIPFRVVFESKPGLSHARSKGFSSAKFNIALMVDDDNSLSKNYLNDVWNLFKTDQKIGMVGGMGIPRLENTAPWWFESYAYCYATGSQPNNGEHLYGAGLALRLDILEKLNNAGFSSLLSDRKGAQLSSGGDTELCMAYRMAGYHLVSDDNLTFLHHLSSKRTNWRYLRKLFFGFGQAKVGIDIYADALAKKPIPTNGRFPYWFNRTIYLISCLKKDTMLLVKSIFFNMEGNEELLRALARVGQVKGIFQARKQYLQLYKQVYSFNQQLKTID